MADLQEVIFTSDASGQLCNSYVWDPHAGTSLMVYKGGGNAAPKTLHLLGNDYITSVEQTKPLMNIWLLNSQQPVQNLRIVLPGRANSVAFSPDAKFCVAGVNEKIYLWQVNTGNLLTVLNHHYQNISCLKFCDDSTHFVSASEDGTVMIWTLATLVCDPELELITQSVAGQHDPLHIISDHSLPVTDIFIGKDGLHGRVVTVSIDRSCKIYEMSTAELLLNLIFDCSLTCVTMDIIEVNLFVGSSTGNIHQVSLINPPRERDYYINNTDKSLVFLGHSKAVNCISASIDGVTLLSGSSDEQVFLWHIPSQRKIRVLPHKGSVLNAFFKRTPAHLFATKFTPSTIIRNFQRTKESNTKLDIEVISHCGEKFWTDQELQTSECSIYSSSSKVNTVDIDSLKNEINRLKQINGELYTYAAHKIVASVAHLTVPLKKRKRSKNKGKDT